MTLSELKMFLDNMYDQLDPATIDNWDINGLEVYDENGDKYTIILEAQE